MLYINKLIPSLIIHLCLLCDLIGFIDTLLLPNHIHPTSFRSLGSLRHNSENHFSNHSHFFPINCLYSSSHIFNRFQTENKTPLHPWENTGTENSGFGKSKPCAQAESGQGFSGECPFSGRNIGRQRTTPRRSCQTDIRPSITLFNCGRVEGGFYSDHKPDIREKSLGMQIIISSPFFYPI